MTSSLLFSVFTKVYENLKFNVKTDFRPNKLLLENAKLSLYKGKN